MENHIWFSAGEADMSDDVGAQQQLAKAECSRFPELPRYVCHCRLLAWLGYMHLVGVDGEADADCLEERFLPRPRLQCPPHLCVRVV
jgi:hypothetical protein